ncbi:MAG: KxYKxGKxW signal peptide domain-containing protein [Sphingobacterium sp.]
MYKSGRHWCYICDTYSSELGDVSWILPTVV